MFIGSIDDIRLYGVALSPFEIKRLFSEGITDLEDLGEESYSISIWAKPDFLSPKWNMNLRPVGMKVTEGNMQAKMRQGRLGYF